MNMPQSFRFYFTCPPHFNYGAVVLFAFCLAIGSSFGQSPTPGPSYTAQDLGTTAPGDGNFGRAINAKGKEAGAYAVAGVGGDAMIYEPGANRDLGTLGGHFSTAWGINDSE